MATLNDNATPMPPTLLFHLELQQLEAEPIAPIMSSLVEIVTAYSEGKANP